MQIQFTKLALAEAAQQFAAEATLRFQLAPEGFVGVPLVHTALDVSGGMKVGESRRFEIPFSSAGFSSRSST
jgi:hypothetical protein